ncbi:MAG: chromosome partitioning protein ParA, partial [Prevotella sp.]|nr:chromosome partitioning protein ParA [Prevotella sp.]
MTEQKSMAPETSITSKGFNINPLDILRFLLSKWYWFVLSAGLFGGWAWYNYSTTQFRYSTNATVMFKDAHSSARQAGLDRLANATPQVNISNEILQFQSPELMRKAVLRLHAEVDYMVMDYLRVEELYTKSPIRVTFHDLADDQEGVMDVKPIDESHVRLSGFPNGPALLASLGKTVKTPLGRITVTKTLYYSIDWLGHTIKVKKNDINTTVGNLCPNLQITQGSSDGGPYGN